MQSYLAAFENIRSIKSGLKIGKKLSDGDNKWLERWYEIQFSDIEIEDPSITQIKEIEKIRSKRDMSSPEKDTKKVLKDIKIKGFEKFWVDMETGNIEGDTMF